MLRPSHQARAGGQRQSPGVSFSSQQSDKLWSLLTRLYAVGGYSHTFGALDPVQVIQMAPSLSSIYISGWQSSSTASVSYAKMPSTVCSVNVWMPWSLTFNLALSWRMTEYQRTWSGFCRLPLQHCSQQGMDLQYAPSLRRQKKLVSHTLLFAA